MNRTMFMLGIVLSVLVLFAAYRVFRAGSWGRLEKWAIILSSLGITALGATSLLMGI